MKLTIAYIEVYSKELLRNHTAAFFTLFFPGILFQFFGLHVPGTPQEKIVSYIIYCNYAVQTVMLQTLGITIATAKNNLWNQYLKTLPVSAVPMILGRIGSHLLFAFTSLIIVVGLAVAHHFVFLNLQQQSIILMCALLGGVPMALIATWLGNLINAAAARSLFILANLLLLLAVFSFLHNGTLSYLLQIIPSCQWLIFSFSALNHQFNSTAFYWLASYTILFYLLNYASLNRFFSAIQR